MTCASRIRVAAGRSRSPRAAVIDSQSVKGSDMIGRHRRGYDAGKKIEGSKRHIAVDVIGLLLTVLVTAHSVQDRDGAKPLLWNLRQASRQSRSSGPIGATPGTGHLGHERAEPHRADRQTTR